MATKGVDYHFYIGNLPADIFVSATDAGASNPKLNLTVYGDNPGWTKGNVQIGIAGVGIHGNFAWTTETTPEISKSVSINPVTGNATGADLINMMKTPSYTDGGINVSFGFYDAGPGFGDLTNQDQVYAYFTLGQNNWMGQLATAYPQVNTAPFSSFVLPGAHDSGTFDQTTVKMLLLGGAATIAFLKLLGPGGILGAVVAGLTAAQAETAITNLAVTQKDNITTMLNLGCRYFDFRPGRVPKALQAVAGDIYHIHTVIPGYPYKSFLTDVLTWLEVNSSEVVVVNANTQGFDNSLAPSDETLQKILSDAIAATGSTVATGGPSDLGTAYGDLVSANKRLIFLNQYFGWHAATKYDSYNEKDYFTTDPATVIVALNAMNKTGQSGNDYTVLQLQGTATGTGKKVVVSAALSQSLASSPLMSTKSRFDNATYPWTLSNVPSNLASNQLVVLLNDFVDNALAATASQLTLVRIGPG